MPRKCELTGVKVQYGNNVSHSHRKTRRSFRPNMRNVIYKSDITGQKYKLKIIAKTMRSIEKLGGIDAFIVNTQNIYMSCKAKKLKKEIIKRVTGEKK